MNAATLTAIRGRHNEGPDGDRVFVLACQLGHCGRAAQLAYEAARREVFANDRLGTHHDDIRIADRLIELVDHTDPATAAQVVAIDLAELTALHDDLVPRPGGASAFLLVCADGHYGDGIARATDAAFAELAGTPQGHDLTTIAARLLQLAATSGEVAA